MLGHVTASLKHVSTDRTLERWHFAALPALMEPEAAVMRIAAAALATVPPTIARMPNGLAPPVAWMWERCKDNTTGNGNNAKGGTQK